MSQHRFINKLGREILYGTDKPTGGYFLTEFYRDDELSDDSPTDVVMTKSSLTIQEIKRELELQEYMVSSDGLMELITEWNSSPNPTPLQYNINMLFGGNLQEMIDKTAKSVQTYLSENVYSHGFTEVIDEN